jgi:hypothetical protein
LPRRIGRCIEAGYPGLRTSSEIDETSGTESSLFLSVFEVTPGGRWHHFADFVVRCRRAGTRMYAVDVSCNLTIIESRGEAIRIDSDKIEETLREHRLLGASASETTRYRTGIPQLGEEEKEVISDHVINYSFHPANVEHRLDCIEAGEAFEDIGELALVSDVDPPF